VARQVLRNVQILRFIAAAGVLTSHTADLLIPHDSPIWRVEWTSGVDIFFVISGFIMAYLTVGCFGDARAAGSFLARRAIRIAPSYWFFTTLMVGAVLVFPSHVQHSSVTAPQLVTSYGFVPWPRADGRLNPILSQGWTLNYEAFFYVAFALAMPSRRGLLWLACLFALLAAAHPWIPPRLFVLRFWSDPIILEFLAGIGLGLLFAQGRRLPFRASALLCGAALILFVAPSWVHPGSFHRVLTRGIPATLLAAAFILGPEPTRPGAVRRALVRLGDASYTLYLSHTLTINAVILLWRRAGIGPPWVGLFVGMAAAIAIALLLYQWLERPMTERLQRAMQVKPIRGAAAVAP
jgi:peptidoglycan/LPS O-acetylase OafA/YrhL